MYRYSAIISDGTFPFSTAVIQGDPRTCFAKASVFGFDCVQLTVRRPSDYPVDLINSLCEDFGLSVSAMATGRMCTVDNLCMGSSDEINRRKCINRLCSFADYSALIGHPAIVIGAVRGYFSDALSEESYYKQFDKSFRELSEYCEKLSVPVILEAIDHFEADAYCDPAETLQYVEEINSPILYMYLDRLHLLNEGKDIPATIRQFAGQAYQIDLSGENRCAPMASSLDYREIAKAIKESDFKGILSLEHLPKPPEDAAAESLRFIKGLLNED